MSLPIIENLTRVRGDTKAIEFLVNDESGNPIDPTGFSALFTVNSLRSPPDITTQIFQLVAIITTGTLTFLPAVGDVDILGTFYYDVQLTDPSGLICTISTGSISFVQDITK